MDRLLENSHVPPLVPTTYRQYFLTMLVDDASSDVSLTPIPERLTTRIYSELYCCFWSSFVAKSRLMSCLNCN